MILIGGDPMYIPPIALGLAIGFLAGIALAFILVDNFKDEDEDE